MNVIFCDESRICFGQGDKPGMVVFLIQMNHKYDFLKKKKIIIISIVIHDMKLEVNKLTKVDGKLYLNNKCTTID